MPLPGHVRILIVDDDFAFRESLRKILSKAGYVVDEASGATHALALMAMEKFDIVFSDMKMPGMSGLDLLKTIKQNYPEVHVVLLTAHNELASHVEALNLQASGFLCKPVKRHEILEALESLTASDHESRQ